jgi:hypothetical protein
MLSEYETGKKTPRTLQALKIAEVTDGAVPVSAWGEPPEPDEPPASERIASTRGTHKPTGTHGGRR